MNPDVLKALGYVVELSSMVSEINRQMRKVEAILIKAQQENRAISADEWAELDEERAAAKDRIAAAVQKREQG